ncbi:MAG TPA: ATPase domain-containing protein [Polyangiaceae bacterium]
MSEHDGTPRIRTGVRNLDALLSGGIPKGSGFVIGGSPGAGKTIMAQQICFHNATAESPALYFNTVSEPTAKTLRYLTQFNFFDPRKVEAGMHFVDLGTIMRTSGLDEAVKLVMHHVETVEPSIVVIDSFKVFDDLAKSQEELRKFGYELAIRLMAWEVTSILLGEYAKEDFQTNPLFSIADGLLHLTQRERAGEQQRFLQLIKMRGTAHSRDEHPFVITADGIEVFAPRVMIRRKRQGAARERCKVGVSKLDELLGAGIPRGSSLLIAGVAGTGKTALLLEFIYRGALAGEKGILFSFEETDERLLAAARGFGWDFEALMERGLIEVVFIPQPEIMVEADLLMMQERVDRLQARRVAIDSISVFLHKVDDPRFSREKVFQLASIVGNAGAVGFFATDVPYGTNQISRFGVEETVVDGVILLSSPQEGLERQRYLEVYKLRGTSHLKGKHNMLIDAGGIRIFPRYDVEVDAQTPPPAIDTSRRLASGIPGLDPLLGGGLLERSVTLVSGSAGSGKSTFGVQFLLAGVTEQEPGLYMALEESPEQILKSAEALGLPVQPAVASGMVKVVHLSREHLRANQLLTILSDEARAIGARRLVLDGASQLANDGVSLGELRQLMQALTNRFKVIGVTSVVTLESRNLYAAELSNEYGLSPITDNIIRLRHSLAPGGARPVLTVVKTRGSAHDWGTYELEIGASGLRIGPSAEPQEALTGGTAAGTAGT